MSYRHPQLPYALAWQHPGTRIDTVEGVLTITNITPRPTDAQQEQCVTDYFAYLDSTQCKDDEWQAFLDSLPGKACKAIALVLVDKGVCTVNELKVKYRAL